MSISPVNSTREFNNLINSNIRLPYRYRNSLLDAMQSSPNQPQPQSLKQRVEDYNKLIDKIQNSNEMLESMKSMNKKCLIIEIVGLSVAAVISTALLVAGICCFIFAVSTAPVTPFAGLIVLGAITMGTIGGFADFASFVGLYKTVDFLCKATAPKALENTKKENEDLKLQQIEFLKHGTSQTFLKELEKFKESEFREAGCLKPSKKRKLDQYRHELAVELNKQINALMQLITA